MTKTAWVYVMRSPQAVKIGVTTTDPERRRKTIQDASGQRVELVATFEVPAGKERWIEARAHRDLADHRTFGEWFHTTTDEAVAAVRNAIAHTLEATPPRATQAHEAVVSPPPADLSDLIERLEHTGLPVEVAAIHALGGTATSRQIASALTGDPPARGTVLSIGRRCYGHQNRGYLDRWGDEWHLTSRSRTLIDAATETTTA